ncbi:MAG: hypothetical protein WD065_19950, partial [Planctomycetaceae bacterium]
LGYPVVADDCYEAFGRLKPAPERRAAISPLCARMEDDVAIDEEVEPIEIIDEDDEPNVEIATNDNALMPRHALHAGQLGFQHPIFNEWMTFTAPLPVDMQRTLDRLRG